MRSSAKRYYVFLLVFTFLSTHASAITLSRTIEIKDVGELPKTYQKNRSTIKLGTKIWEKIKSLFNNKQKVGDAIQGLSYGERIFTISRLLQQHLDHQRYRHKRFSIRSEGVSEKFQS
jgi:hypothetical protein